MSRTEPPITDVDGITRAVLDGLHEGCQVIGFDWTYLYVNDALVEQGRRSKAEMLGRTMTECYPGIDGTPMFEALRRCMEDREPHAMLNEFEFPDGSRGWFQLRLLPVPHGVCVLSLDVTESKRARATLARTEEQMRHAQKMEAVGRLASGVAHDFNNLLSVILSYADLLLSDLDDAHPMRRDLEEIGLAGERAAALTRQLLAFSRQQALAPRVIDLSQVVGGMERMVARLVGADVELVVLRDPALGKVCADPGQVEQVVMNLAVNARDAMPRGGKLTFQLRNVELDEPYASEHLGAKPGPYVMLAVTDTGLGMDRETQARVFEPFFTTKEKGKGTGLGLSTVFGIVRQSGGHIGLYSEPGRGTTFKIYFPTCDGAVVSPSTPPPSSRTGGGHETILVVEDDDQVRSVACGILRRYGYTVLEASGAGDALLVAERHGAAVHLLLADTVLPLMTGPELAARLLAARPSMRVLFMSGYPEEAMAQHGLLDSDAAFLQKPMTPERLGRKVREVLAGR